LTRKMQPVCRGVISAQHIYHMYYATSFLYYVITNIYGSHVHSRLCSSFQVCCYIKWSQKHDTEVALGRISFFCWTWMPFKLPNWTSTMMVMEEYHTKVVCMHKQNSEEIPFLGHLTSKSDVCSFRVVLLELMIGRRSLDKSRSAG
jgi:hypothetical protein